MLALPDAALLALNRLLLLGPVNNQWKSFRRFSGFPGLYFQYTYFAVAPFQLSAAS